jgi:hypothetical protein
VCIHVEIDKRCTEKTTGEKVCSTVEWEYGSSTFQGSEQVCRPKGPCGPGTSGACQGDYRACPVTPVGKANPDSDHGALIVTQDNMLAQKERRHVITVQ